MNRYALLLLFLIAPLPLQARTDFTPLLGANEHESNRNGYHVKCDVAGNQIYLHMEVSPTAAAAITGMRLMFWDENGQNFDMELTGTKQKDGGLVLSLTLPKSWLDKSELAVFSRSYEGAANGLDWGGYSLSFKQAPKQ